MTETTTNFAITENPAHFSSIYNFQLELDQKYHKEIFVDSSDILFLILGLNNYTDVDKNIHKVFNYDLFRNKMTMLHSFMYNGYLTDLRLLNPHMFEFMEQIDPKSKTRILNNWDLNVIDFQFKAIQDDFRYRFKLIDPKESSYAQFENDLSKIISFKDIANEAEVRFKQLYLVNNGHPKKRATAIKIKGIISFEIDENFNVSEIAQTELFKKLFELLEADTSKNFKKASRSRNNFHDALALCQLQAKLDNFYDDIALAAVNGTNTKNIKIPLFYGRGKILNVVKKISKNDKILKSGRRPFMYSGESGEHLIVQDEDFFLLDGLYQFEVQNSSQLKFNEFVNRIHECYDFIPKNSEEIDQEDLTTPVSNENTIIDVTKKAVEIAFFEKWWKKSGKKDLLESLKLINDFTELKGELNYEVIDREFEETYKEVRLDVEKNNLGLKYLKMAFDSNFLESFSKKNNDGKLNYDLDQEFFSRFSYPMNIILSIKDFAERYYFTDDHSRERIKIEILDSLQHALDYDVLKSHPTDDNIKKMENLWVMLSILWIEREFEILCEFCTAIRQTLQSNVNEENGYPNYQIGLLHAAAIIQKSDSENVEHEKVEEILDCITGKFKHLPYKVCIGVAFIYSQLWENNYSLSIPEIRDMKPVDYSTDDKARRQKYYNNCKEYIMKAYGNLANPTTEPKEKIRRRKQNYCINLYIYLETLNRPLAEFPGDLEGHVRGITSQQDFTTKERYLDTLARYSQRSAAKIAIDTPADQKKYISLIDFAQKKVEKALELAKAKNNVEDLEILEALENELDYMKIPGCSYFEGFKA